MASHRRFATPLLVALLAACAARQDAPAPPTRQEVRLGLVLPLSGEHQAFGESVQRGARMALQDRERDGGQAHRAISLVSGDSATSPGQAVAAAARLIDQERVVAILGEVVSSRTIAMVPTSEARRVPLLTPTGTNPRVTHDGPLLHPYAFRTCVEDPQQGAAMARFARARLGVRRVAILRDRDAEYSRLLADTFKAEWERQGDRVIIDLSYATGDMGFQVPLENIQGTAVSAIYVPGYYGDVALIAREARRLGMRQVFLGADGWESEKLLRIAQGALDGSYFTSHVADDDPDPLLEAFKLRYRSAHGEPPNGLAVLGYDAARVLFDAVDRAGAETGPAIRDALEQTRGFPGVAGKVSIGRDHDVDRPLVVFRVAENAYRFFARVPAGAAAPSP